MTIKDFRDLEVYQLANKLTIEVYGVVEKFPNSEKFGLSDQLKRASSSVGANIAEGFGRFYTKEYIKFLYIARGSLMEVFHFLILSKEIGHIKKETLEGFELEINKLSVKINNLISALSKQQVSRSNNKTQGVTNER